MSGCTSCGSITLFKGKDGRGIVSYVWTSNSGGFPQGTAGTTDTYTITYTDGTTSTTVVTNGANGAAGAAGAPGVAGTDGVFGGYSGEWEYDNAIAVGTGSGEFRFNNVTPASVTKLYINEVNGVAANMAAFLASFDNSGNFGLIRVSKKDNSATFWMGSVTAVADLGSEHDISVSYITSNGTFTDEDDVVISFVNNGASPTKGYSVYTALMSQSGTTAPTSTVLGTNEIGAIVWSYIGVGTYRGTLVGAFTANKTWLMLQDDFGSGLDSRIFRVSDDVIEIDTQLAGVPGNGAMNGHALEIRVYD